MNKFNFFLRLFLFYYNIFIKQVYKSLNSVFTIILIFFDKIDIRLIMSRLPYILIHYIYTSIGYVYTWKITELEFICKYYLRFRSFYCWIKKYFKKWIKKVTSKIKKYFKK